MNQITSNKQLEQYLNDEFNKLRNKAVSMKPSKYFGQIGSTTLEDIPYDLQLKIKLAALKKIFTGIIPDNLIEKYIIHNSPLTSAYRFKMDFVCSYDPIHEPNSRFGQRKKGNFNWVVDMDECNLIDEKWFKKIRGIYDMLNGHGLRNYDLVKHDGEVRYIVTKIYKDQSMIIFVTRTSENAQIIDKIAKFSLEQGFKSVYWLQNEGIGDVSTGAVVKTYGDEFITIPILLSNKTYLFKINHETFFQNNIYCFEEILKYLNGYLSEASNKDKTLFDLYCGVGTIGICFAKYFQKLIGLEIVAQSITLAKGNAILNNVANAEFDTIDLFHSFSDKYKIIKNKVVIVDPPRTGLDVHGVEELLKLEPEKIIYISCNPITQARDLKIILESGYEVESIQGFDMFPQTNHMENVVILKK